MLTLYDASRCPFCARARIALAEKGVPYETVTIDLADRPAWIYEKNATGRVPVLEEDGWLLPESGVILEYLEERYPEPPLLPADPGARAEVRLLVHRFDLNLGSSYYAFRREEEGAAGRLAGCLARLDAGIAAWRHPYGLADIAYLPWLLRLRELQGYDLSPYPALVDRIARASERPAVAAEVELLGTLQPA